MRFVFVFLIMVHGFIHLIGFLKAFEFATLDPLSKNISKTMGLVWLFVSTILFITAFLYLKKDWWFYIAILAITLSQILIIMFWKDAKFGTLANVIILIACLSAYGNYVFNIKVNNETESLLKGVSVDNDSIIRKEDLTYLPEIVQNWLQNSGVIAKEKIVSVRLNQ